MATDPSSLLETLRSKAMLLLRREREVFELRQERARIEVWLNVFQRLSLDFQSRSSEDLQARWCAAIVGELCIQSAGIYRIDRAGRCARLLHGSAQAPLSPELPGSPEIFGFLAQHGDSAAAKTLERSQNHQSYQGRIAIGLGGLTGVADDEGGPEEATRDVPERHSDFVFAVFAAKHGFVGVTLLFLLYAAFLGALLSVASRLREPSGRFLAVGLFAMFAIQVVVNLAMVAGLLPVVGVPAPFLTYGGSSLLVSWLSIGLLLAVGSDPPVEFGRTTYGD